MSAEIPIKKGEPIICNKDEHPRLSSVEKLSALKPIVRADGTVTAGNASGVNDGAAALIIASADAVKKYNLNPVCRILGMQSAGVPPRIMGIGPVFSTRKLLDKLNMSLSDFDIIEINEAFAAQVLACTKELNINPEYKTGYWGNITSRECGAVGGHMVRKMIASAEQALANQATQTSLSNFRTPTS